MSSVEGVSGAGVVEGATTTTTTESKSPVEVPKVPGGLCGTRMVDDLDVRDYDVAIVGTSLAESVLAAALARVGLSVIHLDTNSYYGSELATYSLYQFRDLLKEQSADHSKEEIFAVGASYDRFTIKQGHTDYLSDVKIVSPGDDFIVSEKENRFYNIDLSPHLLLSNGRTVSTLASSGVSRYIEFKALDKCLLLSPRGLWEVPDSRSALFSNSHLDLVEKRLLMKFLQEIQKELTEANTTKSSPETTQRNQTFVDYLVEHKLTPKLINFVLYSISLLVENQNNLPSGATPTTVEQGKKALITYLKSVGKYNSTPFLVPMYGASEIPQAYCRECAVYKGTYMLRSSVCELHRIPAAPLAAADNSTTGPTAPPDSPEGTQKPIIQGSKDFSWEIKRSGLAPLTAKWAIASNSTLHFAPSQERINDVDRCVCITVHSLQPPHRSVFVVVPPMTFNNPHSIHVLQLGNDTSHCPEGKYLIHLITPYSAHSRSALQTTLDTLFPAVTPTPVPPVEKPIVQESAPQGGSEQATPPAVTATSTETASATATASTTPGYLWAAFFTLHERGFLASIPQLSIAPGSATIPDFTGVVEYAENEFRRICGQESEFLPSMPDPSDYIWEPDPQDPAKDTATTSSQEPSTTTTTPATQPTTETTSEPSQATSTSAATTPTEPTTTAQLQHNNP
ncbi:rab proteins geranylgeranyltransferase component A 1 [Pelomyxa schiedti]|nr:rab proteins geranylgeranyltransferase component A 1 [Pelomyxa schiedti]